MLQGIIIIDYPTIFMIDFFYRDGRFKGIAFIDYNTKDSAGEAVNKMNSLVLRNMTVRKPLSSKQ